MGNNNNDRRYPRLKGSENYEPWAIRTRAIIIKEKLTSVIMKMQDPPQKPTFNTPLTEEDNMAQLKYKAQQLEYEKYTQEYKEKSYKAAVVIQLKLKEGPLLQTQYIEGA